MAKTNQHVDALWASLQAQPQRLSASERRRVMTYLAELGELNRTNNYELARMFAVSEKQIRDDRKQMMISIGDELTADNAMRLVAKHTADIDDLIRNAYRGLKLATEGGLAHRAYLETLGKLTQQRFATLQEIGIVRKELGHMAVTSETWQATISQDMVSGVAQIKDDKEE